MSHSGLLFKMRDVRNVGVVFFNVKAGFLSSKTQKAVVYSARRGDVSVFSGVRQGSVLGPLLCLLNRCNLH